ncbi:MAG TPA: hypothetical protein VE569_14340 [Acidimicrobiia bacterium]|nr:hypothetical protein [Acidimicrobiia bacterium]
MRKLITLATVVVVRTLGASPAWDDAHLIAQAACAPDGVAPV